MGGCDLPISRDALEGVAQLNCVGSVSSVPMMHMLRPCDGDRDIHIEQQGAHSSSGEERTLSGVSGTHLTGTSKAGSRTQRDSAVPGAATEPSVVG